MFNKIKKKLIEFLQINSLKKENEQIKLALGKLLSDINSKKNPSEIEEIEFKIFSQFGDDGIIQFLIKKINLDESLRTFVEFGVENYQESNTRFLLFNNNWSGLIIDSSSKNVSQIKNSNYYWKYDLEAICSFVTKKNINNILEKSIITKKIGLLSIDVDGNDYWIWESINYVDPIIVVIEFNSNFGFDEKITVPYKEDFMRTKEHYSNLYWGTSLGALQFLAKKKGYTFICTNTAGNNAYFVKEDFCKNLNLNFKKNFFNAKFRESRDKNGTKNYLRGKEKINEIKELEVINVENNQKLKISEILK